MTDRKDYEVTVASTDRQDPVPDWEKRLYGIADRLDARLGIRFWMVTGLIVASFVVGTPHILVHYQCYGRCGQNAAEFNCQYLGVSGWQAAPAEAGKCPRIRLMI